MLVSAALVSCKKDEAGGTNSEAMAGQWYVVADAIDASGSVIAEDIYGAGRFMVLTYNTAADNPSTIYLDDLGNFWEFKVRVNCDPVSKTFSVESANNESYEDCTVKVSNGKIVLNGATTPSGQPADYIEFDVVFSDDDYVGTVYDALRFSGWRYTGFVNDD